MAAFRQRRCLSLQKFGIIRRGIRVKSSFPTINAIFLYTNAILLNRFDLDELLQSGLTRLAISTFVGGRDGYKPRKLPNRQTNVRRAEA